MGRLDGRIAIVTGAAGGIGRATAEAFLREGARVLLVDRPEAPLAEVARALGERAAWVAADVASEADTRRYVGACVERFGRLDVLHANAGIEGRYGMLVDVEEADFDRVLAVNLKGVWLAIKHAVPAMHGGGSIVVTSSIGGLVGSAGLGPYCASKHALLGLVKTAALELAPRAIRVNALCPGPVDNRMMRSIEQQAAPTDPAGVRDGFEQQVALGRYATNEEVASAAVFLASEDSSYCTGAALPVDGGFLAR